MYRLQLVSSAGLRLPIGEFAHEAASMVLADATGFSHEHIKNMYLDSLKDGSTFSFKFTGGNNALLEITIEEA